MESITNSDAKFRCGDKVKRKSSSVVYTIGAFFYSDWCGCYQYVTTTQNGEQGKIISEFELEQVTA